MKNQGYYSVLGITRNASAGEIRRAYQRLAHRLHPDVSNDPDGERKFKHVTEAYRTLKSPEARLAYNRLHREVAPARAASTISDPFQAWSVLYERLVWSWFWPD